MNDIHDVVKVFNEYLDANEKFSEIMINESTERDIIDLIYRIKHLWLVIKAYDF